MRKFGIALLGLLGGIVVGVFVTGFVARIAIDDTGMFPDLLPLALLVGCITPGLAIAGVMAALALDSRKPPRDRSL